MNQLVPIQQSNVDAYRASTDAATICKDIVVATATTIQGRKYVCVEGWMAIAVAHGCTASARDVEKVEGGVRAIGEIRRMSDGAVIAEGEGFVGEDEPTWYGGQMRGKTLPKRADYAIRAMAQTRAISRACRSAFAHVVVMMNAGLSTTPAEEVPDGGFSDAREPEAEAPRRQSRQEPAQDAVPTITPEQEIMLEDKMREAGVEPDKFLAPSKVKRAADLPAGHFAAAMKSLASRIAKNAEEAKAKANPQHSDILDDEIPY